MYFNVHYVITSGLPIDSAPIDGLSALFIHHHPGIEMVMAFMRYMAFVTKFIPARPM
jgi:hypothetical protein